MENDIIFVGKKPIMSYVMAILTHLNSGNNQVVIKARGLSISTAVDISQVTMHKFMKDLKVSGIEIGTEELADKEGKKRNVSFISIEMRRQ
ncbi:DNA-binding protein Alba [Candidatus Parvarchaeota archaeon]|jgi:DNA-binding protein|nr:DNA-binding protein Alba [Candidatus Parvarchaeota archaeon]